MADYIIVGVVVVLLVSAVVHLVKKRKAGGCCAGCRACSAGVQKQEPQRCDGHVNTPPKP